MRFDNLDQIVDFAIEKEREAAEFYQSVSEQESFSGTKQMFAEFAAEEKKHEDLLLKFKETGVTESMNDYQLKWITDIKRSDYADEIEYQPGMAYHELLMLAMKREEKALKLYNELLTQADTPDSQKLFKMLCQEEAKHKLALETLYDDYMAEMGD